MTMKEIHQKRQKVLVVVVRKNHRPIKQKENLMTTHQQVRQRVMKKVMVTMREVMVKVVKSQRKVKVQKRVKQVKVLKKVKEIHPTKN